MKNQNVQSYAQLIAVCAVQSLAAGFIPAESRDEVASKLAQQWASIYPKLPKIVNQRQTGESDSLNNKVHWPTVRQMVAGQKLSEYEASVAYLGRNIGKVLELGVQQFVPMQNDKYDWQTTAACIGELWARHKASQKKAA